MPKHASNLPRSRSILVALLIATAVVALAPTAASAATRWAPELTTIPFCTDQASRPPQIAPATFQRSVEHAVTIWNAAGAELNATYTGDCGPEAPDAASKPIRVGFHGNDLGEIGSQAGQTWRITGATPQERIVEAQIDIDQNAATLEPACLAHIVIHEMGHALGLNHSDDPADIMYATFQPNRPATCKTGPSLNEAAAIRALYGSSTAWTPPARPIVDLGAPRASALTTTGTGRLLSAPTFDRTGMALAVFEAGSLAQIEASGHAAGAAGIWAQDSGGQFHALLIDAPAFVNAGFQRAFDDGFATSTAATLTRAASHPLTQCCCCG